jgi:ATP-dependent helicase/nuclease subunit B
MGSPLPPEILEALTRGQTILTANQRAARTLRHAYDLARQSAGETLWTPPGIFALDTWLTTLHRQLTLDGHESRLLLNRTQEHTLWRAIIAADPAVSGLRSVDSLAEMAADAWQIQHLHNGRARLREFNVSTDTRAFQRWAEAFDRACSRHACLATAQLPAELTAAQLTLPPAGLALVDFDTIAPAHEALFAAIRQTGLRVDTIRIAASDPTRCLRPAQSEAEELRAAAEWARDILSHSPSATIAIVVPDLAERRPQIGRVFSEVMWGNDVILAKPESQYLPYALFEFSLGQPLAETAPVAAALNLLRWPLESLQLEAITPLLLSPFFGGTNPEDALAAAEFDAFELRHANLLRPELSLEAMIGLVLRSKRRDRLAHLLTRLKNLGAPRLDSETWVSQPHAAWADHFRTILEGAGWTAATNRDSLSFQIHRRWESALDELATLDFDNSRPTAAAALQTLTRIARQAIFAPESRHSPIQILGPLEPGGSTFDALWFLSADDHNWPPTARPNPFIPWHIQRGLGLPAADPIRNAALAQTLTNRLAHSASEVVFSYARHLEEGERRPSPMLRTLNLTTVDQTAESPHQPLSFEQFNDTESIPELAPGVTPGGARILELQAACSFRAFAEIRLHSAEPDSKELGLDARDRGIQIHKIMQLFWNQLHTQHALRGLTTSKREEILDACIETGIARAASAANTPWESAYLDVQRRRLRALLHPWLDFELTRPAFAVRKQEEKRIVKIGPLTLELRADRIDETQGGLLILDYKTGAASPSDWKSDRPDAPQLPLYAVLSEDADERHGEKLGGLAFALLRAGDDLALKGFAGNPGVLDKPAKMEWATLDYQLEDWYRILANLAEAFAHNDPIADPKQYPKTCQRCSQRMLCRLDPAQLTYEDEDDSEISPSS